MMKKILGLVLSWLLMANVALAATLLPNGEQQFLDGNGSPLAAGSVYFYVPNTTTSKTTWSDPAQTVANANPVVLDSNGRAIVYGKGSYRQIVKDADGNTIWDQLTADTTDQLYSNATSTGSGNVQVLTYSPGPLALTAGQTFIFTAGFSNTGATTLNINGLGAKAVEKTGASGPTALTGSEIVAGNLYLAVWNSTAFELINPGLDLGSLSSTIAMSGAAINEAKTTLASAGTMNIGAAGGNYIAVTGTATITAFDTVQAGTRRTLEFAGAATLTHNATSLILPGGANIVTAAGDVAIFVSEGSGNWRCVQYQRVATPGAVPVRGMLAGLQLSNDATTPTTVLDISAGTAADKTGTTYISLASAITKSVSSAWAAGTGAGGMGNGLTIATNTWYHVCAALINGASDAFFDTAVACSNSPTGTTAVRRLGSFKTNGSSQIIAFTQNGDDFLWKAIVVNDINASITSSASTFVVSVPIGLKVNWLGYSAVISTTETRYVLYSPDMTDATTTDLGNTLGTTYTNGGPATLGLGPLNIRTNTTAGIRGLSSVSATLHLHTAGWVDTRGRFD